MAPRSGCWECERSAVLAKRQRIETVLLEQIEIETLVPLYSLRDSELKPIALDGS